MKTKTQNYSHLSGWSPDATWLKEVAQAEQVSANSSILPCGCGVKLDLNDVVYPVVREKLFERKTGVTRLGERVDASVFQGRFHGLHRQMIASSTTSDKLEQILCEIKDFFPQTLIELCSVDGNYLENPALVKSKFENLFDQKMNLLKDLSSRVCTGPIQFGKGHSIRAGGDFLLLDFLSYQEADVFTVANNDTIVTADSVLETSSIISVFTALNNALNDLFVMGVTDRLKVFPVYAGTPQENQKIEKCLEIYRQFYQRRGVELEIEQKEPLDFRVKMIGATVVGETDREVPRFSQLFPRQEIIATHWLGGLSILSAYRTDFFNGRDCQRFAESRFEVLEKFVTPKYLIAKVLRSYFPKKGETFDRDKHVTFVSDVSGPGLGVLEEGATESRVDIYIDDLKFRDERSLQFHRRNHMSCTNGPLLIAAVPSILKSLCQELEEIGVDEIWSVGRVLNSSENPTLLLNPHLARKFQVNDPKLDLFEPLLTLGGRQERRPNFNNLKIANITEERKIA